MTTVRFVGLTEELLVGAMLEEPDPAMALLGSAPGLAAHMVAPPAIGEAMLGRGRVLAAAGLYPYWPGRAEAWLILSPEARPRERLAALRRCQATIEAKLHDPAFRRIEMHMRATAPWCWRLPELLGFRLEGTLRAWDPLGRDYRVFARVGEAR